MATRKKTATKKKVSKKVLRGSGESVLNPRTLAQYKAAEKKRKK